jgi:transposase
VTYDINMRRKVLTIRDNEGLSFVEAGKRFGISKQTVYNWSKRLAPKRTRNKPAPKIDMEALSRDVSAYPDAYQYERARRLNVSPRCVGYALKRLGVSYKKTLNHPKADPEKRFIFSQHSRAFKRQGRSLVFVDESGFAHDMPRTHGYAKKGRRCYGSQDWGAKGRTNVIGALLGGALLTVTLFDTTINTKIFDHWVIQDLIPKLPQRSVVIMDNAAFHKEETIKNALKQAGHNLLYRPPLFS